MEKLITQLFPRMVQIGFNKQCQRIFSLKALANFLGTDLEELIDQSNRIPGVELFPVEVEKDTFLAETLCQLKPEVDNGRLALKHILEKYNEACGSELKIKAPRVLAGILRSYGLTITEINRLQVINTGLIEIGM